jgi:epoxyqueuosine reductase QueG
MKAKENYERLKKMAKDLGADLFGVADVSGIRNKFFLPSHLTAGLDKAISLGVRLLDKILEEIEDRPTKLYYHHYRQINLLLDQISLKISSSLQREGFRVLPIPASQIIDWEKQYGHLSHKRIAQLAGLGWRGRNNLLITPEFGSRIRLVSILTDMELSADSPISGDCGRCRKCLEVCPAGAIREKIEDFDYMGCFEKLRTFRKEGLSNQYICGVCVKACIGNYSVSDTTVEGLGDCRQSPRG